MKRYICTSKHVNEQYLLFSVGDVKDFATPPSSDVWDEMPIQEVPDQTTDEPSNSNDELETKNAELETKNAELENELLTSLKHHYEIATGLKAKETWKKWETVRDKIVEHNNKVRDKIVKHNNNT